MDHGKDLTMDHGRDLAMDLGGMRNVTDTRTVLQLELPR
jgi:hypothetical protein